MRKDSNSSRGIAMIRCVTRGKQSSITTGHYLNTKTLPIGKNLNEEWLKLAKAITTITITQDGKIEGRHLTVEAQQEHIRKVERIMRDIADGDIAVTLRLEEEN